MFRYLPLLAILFALPAYAGIPEAREVARLNNCPPKKIETYQSQMGTNGKTVFQVTCNVPKLADANAAAGPDALLIECDQSLCALLRPLSLDKK
jgi:hypothetical protein